MPPKDKCRLSQKVAATFCRWWRELRKVLPWILLGESYEQSQKRVTWFCSQGFDWVMCELECLSFWSTPQSFYTEEVCFWLMTWLLLFLGQHIPNSQALGFWCCLLGLLFWCRAECFEPSYPMPLLSVCQGCLASAASQHLSKQTRFFQTHYLLGSCNQNQWTCLLQLHQSMLVVSEQFQKPIVCRNQARDLSISIILGWG